MSTIRQDAWSQDEDLLLAEVVLRYIREGGTQLAAFEEVGKKLSRTSAACGFRWNSFVRKQYKSGIELAKKQRKESKKGVTPNVSYETNEVQSVLTEEQTDTLSISNIITFLGQLEEMEASYVKLQTENQYLKQKIIKLENDINFLTEKKRELERSMNLVEEDYKALIEIMERARKMVVLQEEEKSKVKFQMDRNGNLERVQK
ncbi:RsfA family transcriptional regulator [Bacillus sp. FJAT-45066]|uniref:RsfA family transcriptional regulator n=1 Tax=Bacillus sp. FJAT-45066 TaxID=2011010 RepID=UPI000BB8C7A0|nr:RsfA family transcriptional regulator [Bacillus sp. FJAT-45066]